jgi:copper chaperone CopZ
MATTLRTLHIPNIVGSINGATVVEHVIGNNDGVNAVTANVTSGIVKIIYDNTKINYATLILACENVGFYLSTSIYWKFKEFIISKLDNYAT